MKLIPQYRQQSAGCFPVVTPLQFTRSSARANAKKHSANHITKRVGSLIGLLQRLEFVRARQNRRRSNLMMAA
jgi:hypothetical protein